MKYKTEQEFAEKFCDVLRLLGFEVYNEVQTSVGGQIIDTVAVKNNIIYSFEYKKQLSDDLLVQVHKKRYMFHYSYAVIPFNYKKRKNNISYVKEFFLKHFDCGLLIVNPHRMFTFIKEMDNNTIYSYKKTIDCIKAIQNNNYLSNPDINISMIEEANDVFSIISFYFHFDFLFKKLGCKYNIFCNRENIEKILYADQKESSPGQKAGNVNTMFKRSMMLIFEKLKECPDKSLKEIYNINKKDLCWASYGSMMGRLRLIKQGVYKTDFMIMCKKKLDILCK